VSRTVLLLHGLWMPGLAMHWIAGKLQAAGFATEVFSYSSVADGPDRTDLELVKRAGILYRTQNPSERRRLLEAVLSNCIFDRGSLCPTYSSPFGLSGTTYAPFSSSTLMPVAGFVHRLAPLLASARVLGNPLESTQVLATGWQRWERLPTFELSKYLGPIST